MSAGGDRPSEGLPRPFFARSATDLAPRLLGALLVAGGVVVRLTEVEAYEPDDPASHSFIGPRPRTRVMFGPPGHLYVYRSYGIHWCANVVCDRDGVGAAVLLRAGEVLDGVQAAAARRPAAAASPHLLCAGPGRLCTALAITGEHDGADLTAAASPVRLLRAPDGPTPPAAICRTTRIGITKAADAPLRFLELGNRSVSRPPVGARRSRR